MKTKWKILAVLLPIAGLIAWQVSWHSRPEPTPPAPAPAIVQKDVIPPGIVVTESSPSVPPPSVHSTPGDRLLGGYGNPAQPAKDDLILMARAISSFLIIDKQATGRPLSANEEWSAALRGKRPGTEPWFSETSPALDSQRRLIDRWQTPLHFHALGHKQWEIRSAGPDRKLWTEDDLMEKIAG
jgi:hypothetical protein